jgi:hypothetical protein
MARQTFLERRFAGGDVLRHGASAQRDERCDSQSNFQHSDTVKLRHAKSRHAKSRSATAANSAHERILSTLH